jgi:hypothetical protein
VKGQSFTDTWIAGITYGEDGLHGLNGWESSTSGTHAAEESLIVVLIKRDCIFKGKRGNSQMAKSEQRQ